VTINGHPTSFSVEDEFYRELKLAAKNRGKSLTALITELDHARGADNNLSSVLRVFVLGELKLQR